jgi:lysophospholipase L1-like esterase
VTAPRFSTRRSFLFATVICLAFFAIVELLLRVVGVAEPVRPRILLRSMDMDVSFPFMQEDPELFWSLRPLWSGVFQGQQVTINSLGLRGPELQPKPPGRRRIACFGDSITFGFGVADDESYCFFLGRALAASGYETQNAGVTGYTSHQVLGLLRRVAPRLDADVATFLVGWNDGNERAVNDRDYARRIGYEQALERGLDHLYTYRLIKGFYLRAEARAVRRGGKPATAAVRNPDPTGHGARVPVADYRENLAAIVAECQRRGIRPIFVPLPMRHSAGDRPFESPYPAALAESAAQLGVPLVDIGDLASSANVSNQDAFIDLIHLSPAGNATIAKRLARSVRATDTNAPPSVVSSGATQGGSP